MAARGLLNRFGSGIVPPMKMHPHLPLARDLGCGRTRLLLLGLLAVTFASGCSSGRFRANDDTTLSPALRVVAEVTPGRQRGGPGDLGLGEEVRAGYLQTLEAEFSSVSGEESNRTLGDTVDIGSATFPAGTSLDSDFRVTGLSVVSASGYRTETGLEFSFLAGVEYVWLDLEVTGGGLEGENDHQELGGLLGVRLRWLVDEQFRIFATTRISGLRHTLSHSEFGIEYRVVPRVALFTGYRRTEFNLTGTSDSRIDLTWKGLLAGIQLEF